jgi:ubiquinone biosynthesis protein COQ9
MAAPARLLRLRALPRANLRKYHSYDHPSPPGPFNATESAILSASLEHIPSHGFTNTSLALGAKDAGYLDVSTNLFPSGTFSLVYYHLVTQRLALAKHLEVIQASENGKRLGVGPKVKALTWVRLVSNRPIIHRWQEVRRAFRFLLSTLVSSVGIDQ